MKDEKKTKAQLIEELQQVRHRIAELEMPVTGSRETEEQLRILASVVDQSVNSIAVLDTEGNVEYVNSKLLEPYAISPEEIIGINWRSFLSEHSSLRSKYDEMRETVLKKGEVWKGEVSDKTVNGEQIWREATVSPIFNSNGVVTHSVYMSQDITNRKRAESERVRLTAILENTSDLISTAFPDTQLTYLNCAGKALIGWGDNESLIGKKITDIHPKWAMGIIEEEGIPKAISDGIWKGETTIRCRDGTEIPVSQVIMAHKSSTGELQYLSTIMRDISERKRVEEELAKYRDHLEDLVRIRNKEQEELISLFDLTVDMLCTADINGCFRSINKAFETILGYTREELLSKPYIDFVHPDDVASTIAEGDKLSLGQSTIYFENRYRCRDGSYKWLAWTSSPKPERGITFAVARDISEQKQMEDDLKRARDDLEKKVEKRTAELVKLNRQLGAEIFEHKQAEEALRDSEVGLRKAQQIAHVGSWEWNLADNLGEVSEEWCRIYGIENPSQAQNIQHILDTYVHPDDREYVAIASDGLSNEGAGPNLVFRIIRPDGEVRWVEAMPPEPKQLAEDGSPLVIMGTVQDVTDRRNAEITLRESEEKFRSVIEQSIDGIALTDEEGYIVEWNPGLEKITGINRNEAIGQLLWKLEASVLPDELRTPEIENTIESNMQSFLETGESRSGEQLADLIIRKPDGENRFVQISMFSIETDKGFRGASVMRDITERKQAEESKKKSEELFSIAFESSLSAMGITTLQDGKYIIVNPAFTRIFGYEVEESIDHTSQELGIFTDYSDREEIKTELTRTGYVDGYELKTRTKLGERKETLFSAQVVEFQNEKCLLATVTDITERKQAEDALHQYKHIVSSSNDMLALLDTSYTYLSANDSYVKAFNVNIDDLIGNTVSDVFGKEFFKTVIKSNADRCMAGEDVNYQDWFDFPAYEPRYMDINYYPYLGEDNVVRGFVVNGRNITERRQAEEALRESEERYRQLADNVTDIIWTMDMNLSLTYVSPSVRLMRGYSVDEAMTQTLDQMMTPESLELAINTFNQELEVMRERGVARPVIREYEQYCKDGSTIWTQSQMTFLLDSDGDPKGILGVTRDITERKRAEEEMEKLASVVRYSNELVNISTLDGKMIFLNEAGQNMLGIEPEEIEQFQIMEVIPDNLLELVEIELLPALMSGDTWQGELQYRNHKTGRLTDVHAMTFPVKDPVTGKALYLANVSLDITERKQVEEALRESEEKYRTLFESASDAVFALRVDSEGAFVADCNPRALTIFGYDDPAELIGKSPSNFSPRLQSDGRSSKERVSEILDASIAGQPQFFEWISNRQDGTTFETEVTVNRVDIGGETYLQAMVRDITERKRVEETKREAERLKELDQLRSELLSNVSHELRTPLGSIMGYSSLILNYSDMLTAEEKHDYLVTITEASKRLSGLVDSLLDMSRMDTGMFTLNMYSTDLGELISKIVDDAQVRSPDHVIITKLPEQLPILTIDSERIRQVLDNIIENAIKYSDAGTRVTITVTHDDSELIIKTADQGIGIPTDDHERVFDRLYRVSGHGSKKVSGAGLGLSISKGIIEAHGGRIWMENAEQEGTVCSFTLSLIVKEDYHARE